MNESFTSYQVRAHTTAVYPSKGDHDLTALTYCTLGLSNEAGELAGKVKKVHRGDMTLDAAREALVDEAGDVLWYLTQICTELDVTLEQVARANLDKLLSRAERGVIRGSGDNR